MLLFKGWKTQQRSSAPKLSVMTRMHVPAATSQSLAVPSRETDKMTSLDKDHTKSEQEVEKTPCHNIN